MTLLQCLSMPSLFPALTIAVLSIWASRRLGLRAWIGFYEWRRGSLVTSRDMARFLTICGTCCAGSLPHSGSFTVYLPWCGVALWVWRQFICRSSAAPPSMFIAVVACAHLGRPNFLSVARALPLCSAELSLLLVLRYGMGFLWPCA